MVSNINRAKENIKYGLEILELKTKLMNKIDRTSVTVEDRINQWKEALKDKRKLEGKRMTQKTQKSDATHMQLEVQDGRERRGERFTSSSYNSTTKRQTTQSKTGQKT